MFRCNITEIEIIFYKIFTMIVATKSHFKVNYETSKACSYVIFLGRAVYCMFNKNIDEYSSDKTKKTERWLVSSWIHSFSDRTELWITNGSSNTNIITFIYFHLFSFLSEYCLFVLLYTGNKYNYMYCDTTTTSRGSCGSSIYTKSTNEQQ